METRPVDALRAGASRYVVTPGVGMTAVWVASLRVTESERADRLFDDRLAAAFVGAAVPEGTQLSPGPPGASDFLAIRVRFYDDYLLRACAAGARQVVILAAGLDTRAFRLGWPAGVRLFELDLPEVFAFKETVLAERDAVPACQRIPVGVDLREDWAGPLAAAGFDPGQPTAWLAEGLLPYLTTADNDRLLATVTGLATADDHLALDHMHDSAIEHTPVRETADTIRKLGAQWASTVDDPVAWLATHGWHASVSRVPALGVHYGRPLPDFVDLASSNATLLCTATR